MKMKRQQFSIFAILSVLLILSTISFGQDETFANPNADYTFRLPDSKWKMTVAPSASNPNVEYVYGDRSNGHLEIRKLSVQKAELLTDLVHNTEEQKLQFLPGFIAGRDENFRGKLPGVVFNYDYVKASRPMSGRFYYLRANDTTVYVLRFSGYQDSMKSLRGDTDSIARTFTLDSAPVRESKPPEAQVIENVRQPAEGQIIEKVPANSEWGRAGIKAGDIVIKVAGIDVLNKSDLQTLFIGVKKGQEYEMVVVRDKKVLRFNIMREM